MSLAIDSLVTDLIFSAEGELDPQKLVDALGGEDKLAEKQVLDPDMQDPRFEMELSPSRPFRRREERRLMLIDTSVAPMRSDPRAEPIVPLDLRSAKDELVEVCSKLPVRLGRLFALGSWGDAVWVVRSLRDLRGLFLLSWLLDPNMDTDGRRRATPLSQPEFEEKILAYDKRTDELDEAQLRSLLGDVHLDERDDGLLVLDLLEEDGTWNTERSVDFEIRLSALEHFSTFAGAKNTSLKVGEGAPEEGVSEPSQDLPDATAPREVSRQESTVSGDEEGNEDPLPIKPLYQQDQLVLLFPTGRFDLEAAAALGKQDWGTLVHAKDPIDGKTKDELYTKGASFIAPIEFFSEVLVDGKPLTKQQFESNSEASDGGIRHLEVHFPRLGRVQLFVRSDGARYVASNIALSGLVATV